MQSRRLSRDILERVDRVTDFHRSTKLTPESVRANPPVLDPATHRLRVGGRVGTPLDL